MRRLRLQTVAEAQDAEARSQGDRFAGIDCNPLAPAYSYGWSEHLCRGDASWQEIEPELRDGWSRKACNPGLSWDEVRDAVRDGWDHVTPPSRH